MATIKITIKNETTSFALETSPSESIAGVKASTVTLSPFFLLVYDTRLLTSAHVFLACLRLSVCLFVTAQQLHRPSTSRAART